METTETIRPFVYLLVFLIVIYNHSSHKNGRVRLREPNEANLIPDPLFPSLLINFPEINLIPASSIPEANLIPDTSIPEAKQISTGDRDLWNDESIHIDRYNKASHVGVTFYHIPKAGGASLMKDIERLQAANPDRFAINKNGFGERCLEEFLHHKKFIMGFVRVPRDHVLSQYLECRDDTWGHKVTEGTAFPRYEPWEKAFEEWYRYFTYGDPKSSAVHHWTVKDAEYNCYNPRNHATRQFTCTKTYGFSPGHFERDYMPMYNHDSEGSLARGYRNREASALARLKHVQGLGILELYKESMCVFHFQLNAPLPPHCLPGQSVTHLKETIITHGVRKHDIYDFPARVHRDIDELTRSDVALYVAALERFCRHVHVYHRENGFGREQSLLSMDRLEHLKKRTGYIDELWKDGRKAIFDECFRGMH